MMARFGLVFSNIYYY